MLDHSVVNVRYITDYPKCNFSCVYCIAGHGEVSEGRERHWNPDRYLTILENMALLPFKINLRIGVAGEFFLDKTLIQGAAKLSHADNVTALNLITNLSFKFHHYQKIFHDFDESKVAVVASYHPSEVNDPEEWMGVAEAMSKKYDFSVVMVAFPPLFQGMKPIYQELNNRGIEVFVQPFIGPWGGKNYPDDYSEKQRQQLRELMYSRHDYEFLLKLKRPGLCNAGHSSFFVNPFGIAFPCGMGSYEKSIGDLSKRPDIELRPAALPCPFSKCQCDTENMNTVAFEQHYEFDALNQHRYRYRFEAESEIDNRLNEWNIEY